MDKTFLTLLQLVVGWLLRLPTTYEAGLRDGWEEFRPLDGAGNDRPAAQWNILSLFLRRPLAALWEDDLPPPLLARPVEVRALSSTGLSPPRARGARRSPPRHSAGF